MTMPTITNTRTNQTFDTISAAAAAVQNGGAITVHGNAPLDPAKPPPPITINWTEMIVPIGLNDKITLTVTNPAGFSITVTIDDTSSTISSEILPSAPAPTPAVTPAV